MILGLLGRCNTPVNTTCAIGGGWHPQHGEQNSFSSQMSHIAHGWFHLALTVVSSILLRLVRCMQHCCCLHSPTYQQSDHTSQQYQFDSATNVQIMSHLHIEIMFHCRSTSSQVHIDRKGNNCLSAWNMSEHRLPNIQDCCRGW